MLENLLKSLLFFKNYEKKHLKADVIAGITLGLVLIPIGLAFGELAGVNAMVGVKASIFPLIIYTLFSSSRLIIVGPDASTAALVGAAIIPLAHGNQDVALVLASAFALIVGLFLIGLGFARLGFIANFIPKPVLTGFMSALGLMIIIKQLSKILGISLSAHDDPIPTLIETLNHLSQVHVPTFLIAFISIVFIRLCHRYMPWMPGQIVVMILGIISVTFFSVDQLGVETVGVLQAAIPQFALPPMSWSLLLDIIPASLSITMIAFTDSILTAKVFAAKNKTEMEASQEAVAIGLSNLSAGLSQTMPVSVSGSRTSIAEAAGAQTRMACLIAPCVIVFFIFMNGAYLISFLPHAILGAILFNAGMRLVELKELKRFFKVKREAFFISFITLVSVLFMGVLPGVLMAIAISCALMIYSLIRIPCTVINDHLKEGILIVNIGPGLFFANAESTRSTITRLVKQQPPHLKQILIDGSTLVTIDLEGIDMLVNLQKDLELKQISLGILQASKSVKASIKKIVNTKKILLLDTIN